MADNTVWSALGHVLVVDDHLEARDRLAGFLRRRGYQVSVAEDADTALKCVHDEFPDLVMLDVGSAGIKGLAVLQQILAHSPEAAIITMAGVTEEEVARQSLELGAADFISKPLDLRYLETSVRARMTIV